MSKALRRHLARNKVGLAALSLLLIGFWVDWTVSGREDQYCFGPPTHNLAWQCGRLALLLMLISPILGAYDFFGDRRWSYGLAVLLLVLPLLLLDAIRAGCW